MLRTPDGWKRRTAGPGTDGKRQWSRSSKQQSILPLSSVFQAADLLTTYRRSPPPAPPNTPPLPRQATPGITIEIRWFPAHKGIAGNEKADEWAKIAAEEPDTHGAEGPNYSDRTEVCPMPLPRSLANLKREISDKKWMEARQWARGRTSSKKYRMPESQKPGGTVAGSTKRLASRFYQLKTRQARTG
jgi:hypothetical protein